MSTTLSQVEEEVHCFVCDMLVSGRYYSLATCRTQSSKTRIIEKLGALVGDQYMVVISEDDVICRTCATFMNTLDRLETEALQIRAVVLKFLEKKYELSEGELVNQKNTGLSQPPRIVPSENPGAAKVEKKGFAHRGSFMARKRKAALAQMAELEEQENTSSRRGAASHWMQCNTCKYTTSYDAFMAHHIQDEMSDHTISADAIVPPTKRGPAKKSRVTGKPTSHESELLGRVDENSHDSDDSETVEMIAAEINEYAVNKTETDVSIITKKVVKEEPGTIKVQIVSQKRQRKSNLKSDEKEVMIQLPNLTEDEGTEEAQMITGDLDQEESEMSVEEQMMKMNEGDSSTVYVQMVDVEKSGEVGGATKQVMTVSDDGTVEMVEVMWDEEGQEAHDDTADY